MTLTIEQFDTFFNAMLARFNPPTHVRTPEQMDGYKQAWFEELNQENFDRDILVETFKRFRAVAKKEGREWMPTVMKFLSYRPDKDVPVDPALLMQHKATMNLTNNDIRKSTHDDYDETRAKEITRLCEQEGISPPAGKQTLKIGRSLSKLPANAPKGASRLVANIFENKKNRREEEEEATPKDDPG